MKLLWRNLNVLLRPRRYRAELGEAVHLLLTATEATNGVVESIRAFLESDAWEVRNCAVKLIARTGCAALYPVLAKKLAERDEAGIIRRNCAELLLGLGLREFEVVTALRGALDDPYWEARAEAARALAALADPSAELERELLGRLREERNLEVRAALAQALGGLAAGREAFEAVAALADEGPWLVRHQAAVALVEMAARHPAFGEETAAALRRLDLLAEGTATTSVFKQRMLELAGLAADGRALPPPEAIRGRYFHLKRGWLRPDEE